MGSMGDQCCLIPFNQFQSYGCTPVYLGPCGKNPLLFIMSWGCKKIATGKGRDSPRWMFPKDFADLPSPMELW